MSAGAVSPMTGSASDAEQLLLSDLEREALRSEQLRALILAIFCAAGAITFALLDRFLAPHIELLRQHPDFGLRIAITLSPLSLYELCIYRLLSRVLAAGRPRRWLLRFRYASAVLELLVPSALVYAFMANMQPVYSLLMPPTSLYFLFILLSALRFELGLSIVTGVAAAAQYLLLYVHALKLSPAPAPEILLVTPFHHLSKAGAFIVCGIVAGLITTFLRQRVVRSLRFLAERNRVTSMFGLYVSPSVVDQLMSQSTDLEGELRQVCVLFLDIRNFTQFAEGRSPQEVVQFLNTLFAFMIDTVSQHGGFINKFLGDGFMAIFGAPLPDPRACDQAIAAARRILAQLDDEIAASRLPSTRIGIGIHYGPVLTGSIGSPRRKEYTVIGDTVNLAARIEQLTKQYDAQLLVSQSVLAACADPSPQGERIGEVAVRGRKAPLELFKLA